MDIDQPEEPAYWDAIAQALEKIDFEGGPERFLDSFLELPRWLGLLIPADWCQKEICNGGLLQFFTNPTGILAPEAVEGFRAIGLLDWAELLEEGVIIRDRDPRDEFGARFPGEERSEWDPFHELDEKYFAKFASGGGRFENAAQTYFLKHMTA